MARSCWLHLCQGQPGLAVSVPTQKGHDLVWVFISAVRSILEYACVWPSTPASLGNSRKCLNPFKGQAMCTVAPDLSYRQTLANFGLPMWEDRRQGLARDFFIKIVRNPNHKLRHLLPHERTIKYGLRTAKPYQSLKFNTAKIRKNLIPYGTAHWIQTLTLQLFGCLIRCSHLNI